MLYNCFLFYQKRSLKIELIALNGLFYCGGHAFTLTEIKRFYSYTI